MLSSETRLRPNDAEVTATVIDGEAIMINLTSGVYYSTDGVGARVWQLATGGANIAEIADVLAEEYAIPTAQAHTDVTAFLAQCVEERLLLTHEYLTPPEIAASTLPTEDAAASGAPTKYAAPHLEIYREMGHLLALDPPMPGLENLTWDEPRHA